LKYQQRQAFKSTTGLYFIDTNKQKENINLVRTVEEKFEGIHKKVYRERNISKKTTKNNRPSKTEFKRVMEQGNI